MKAVMFGVAIAAAILMGVLALPQHQSEAYTDGFQLSAGSITSANEVTLSWTALSGADKYQVYVKTYGGSWSAVGGQQQSSNRDREVGPYYGKRQFQVRAFDSGNDRIGWTNQVNLKFPRIASFSLTSISGSAGDCDATFSWTTKNSAGITGFTLERRFYGHSFGAVQALNSSVSSVAVSVPNRTSMYRVKASGEVGSNVIKIYGKKCKR